MTFTTNSTPSNQFQFHINQDVASMRNAIERHLRCSLARDPITATRQDWYMATALAVRDRIMDRFITTMQCHAQANTRRMYYLSLEYLMGRMLIDNLHNSGLYEVAREALGQLGHDLDLVDDAEPDMGLGNGGLGRLAACFLDSLATLDLPAVGYGIFYQFGLFRQRFVGGKQTEFPDSWLQVPSPWFVTRNEYGVEVKLYGHVENTVDDRGDFCVRWVASRTVLGVPHDLPICGYGARTVNFLRLWEARASEEFDLNVFNQGGYVEAVRDKAIGESITKVLYPNDKSESGKELRLVQQYFFAACSLRDIIRRYFRENKGWGAFADKVAIQLNDTHPAIAVAELMRILVDEERLPWDEAWNICRNVFSYTNHTLLPEALEQWSVGLMAKVLPRHLQLIYEINRRFLDGEVAAKWPGDEQKRAALSLIDEHEPKHIRMAYLCVIASHTVNGVAALHTQLLRERLLADFAELYPTKFQNKTNGITPRRWLKQCNPRLSALITDTLGHDHWPVNLDELRELEKHVNDKAFQRAFADVKQANKIELAAIIEEQCGITVDPGAIFDVQIKRMHEYKRQHLNLLYILTLYRRLIHNPDLPVNKRVFIFGAKAAPGYDLAKRIILAINSVAEKINHDARIRDKIKVAFLPNYSVSLAEKIIPATDVSQQISTAGKEASGTGNMKLALNGAVTIGTLDGANVEILEEVGADNIFIFGNTVQQLDELRCSGYRAMDYYHQNEELRAVLDWLRSDVFAPGRMLAPVVDSILTHGDPFFVAADYDAYCATQDKIDEAYSDRERWTRMSIINTARVGKFSSDRTIREYARDIWQLGPRLPSTP